MRTIAVIISVVFLTGGLIQTGLGSAIGLTETAYAKDSSFENLGGDDENSTPVGPETVEKPVEGNGGETEPAAPPKEEGEEETENLLPGEEDIIVIEQEPSLDKGIIRSAAQEEGGETFSTASGGVSPFNIDTSILHYRSDNVIAFSRQMDLNNPDGTNFVYTINAWEPGEEERMMMLFSNIDQVAANYGITGSDKIALTQAAIWTIESGTVPSNPSYSSVTSSNPNIKTALGALYYSITGGYASIGVSVDGLEDGGLVYCGTSFDGKYARYGPLAVRGATSVSITALGAPEGSYFGKLFGEAIDIESIEVGQQFYFFIPRYSGATGTTKIKVNMQGDTFKITKYSGMDGYKDMIVFEGANTGEIVYTGTCITYGEVEILKIDEYTGEALGDAEFVLEYWFEGEWRKSKTAIIWDWIKKRYVTGLISGDGDRDRPQRIREVKAPYSYSGGWIMEVTFNQYGSYYQVTAVNKPVKLKVNLQKTDRDTGSGIPQGNATLAGAVYGLYMNEDREHPDGTMFIKDQKIAEAITDENGRLEFTDLFPAIYYIKELTPSEGYMLDETIYEIDGVHDGEEGTIVRDVIVTEQVIKQGFEIIKTGESKSGKYDIYLAGAGFKIFLISELTSVMDGTLLPIGNEWSNEDFKDYDFNNELTAKVDGVSVPEQFTNSAGYLLSPELPYGKYVVIESTVPEEYLAVDPFVVTIDEDSRVSQVLYLKDKLEKKPNPIVPTGVRVPKTGDAFYPILVAIALIGAMVIASILTKHLRQKKTTSKNSG